jgi:hypothetical protein
MKIRVPVTIGQLALSIALAAVALPAAFTANAQTASNFPGTVISIDGNTLTVKSDAGAAHRVEVPSTAALKRIAPGEKDLSKAGTIQFSDLAVGDRALVKLDPNAPAGTEQALRIVVVKQEDVAQKQQKEREDWQRQGVGGLVKSVDAASGIILLSSGTGATAKTVAVHVNKATLLKRYAPASVRFDQALPAPIDAIHAGDQLRARGTKNAEGTEIVAEEIVSGSFRNIAGTVVSLDAAGSMLVVKDLATKKQVTIHITAEAQMRRLPDRMAQALATRLKGQSMGNGGAQGGNAPPHYAGATGPQSGAPGGGDPQQILNRAPAIRLADLQKGEAVMLVATDGATEVTAITLLAGVEPLLEAPDASKNLLSNWSLGSGGAEAASE